MRLRPVAAFIAILFLFLPIGAQTRVPRRRAEAGQAAALAEAKRLARDFLDYLTKENEAGLRALWSKSSPNAARFMEATRRQFAEFDRRFDPPIVRRFSNQDGMLSLGFPVYYTHTDPKTGKSTREGFMAGLFLVREGGRWRIWEAGDNSAAFADLLFGETEEGRSRLLAEERESLTPALADALVKLGNQHFDNENYRQSLSAYRLAVEVARIIGHKAHLRHGLWGVGAAHYYLRDYAEAVANHRQAVELSDELGDAATAAQVLKELADDYSAQADYRRAIEHYRQSLARYEKLGDGAKAGGLLKHIGDAYYGLQEYAQAIESYRQSLSHTEDFAQRQNILDDISDAFRELKDYKLWLDHLRRSVAPSEADEQALNELTDKFFAAKEPWDYHRWRTLWSQSAPTTGIIKPPESDDRLWGVSIPGSDKINELTIYNARRRVIWARGTHATVRMRLEKKPGAALANQETPSPDKVEYNLDFVKEEGSWKVWRYYPSTLGLAGDLAAVDTEGERNVLLEEEPDLVNLELSRQLVVAGGEQMSKRDYAKAREVYLLALSLAERFGDRGGVAAKLTRIAYAYDSLGEPDKAVELHRQAMAIHSALGEKEKVAESLGSIAMVHYERGNYDAALKHLRDANTLLSGLTDDESKKGTIYTSLMMGEIHLIQGEAPRANEQFERARKISTELGNADEVGRVLQYQGLVRILQGDYKQAVQTLQQSQEVAEDSGDFSSNTLIGMTYIAQGTPNLSVNFMLRRGARGGDDSAVQTDHLRAGYNDFVMSEFDPALEHFRRAVSQQEELGNRVETGAALYFIGLIHFVKREPGPAVESLEKSLRLFEQTGGKRGAAETAMYLAYAYEDAKAYDKALESYRRSLQLYREMDHQFLICRLTIELAAFLQRRGDHEQALRLAESADELAQRLNAPQFAWQSALLLGRAHLTRGQTELAEQFFRLSIRTVERLRTSVSGGDLEKERFFEDKLLPYDGMVELLAGRGQPFAALGEAERRKARVLLEVLQSERLVAARTLPPSERAEEQEAIARLTDLNTRIRRAEAEQPCDRDALAGLVRERRRARIDFETLQARLAAQFPESGGNGGGQPHELSREAVAALVPDEKTALLEYIVSEDRTFVFVIGKDASGSLAVNVHRVEVKAEELRAKVESFREKIAPPDPEQRSDDFKKEAGELYELLLAPAAAELRGKTALIIIPDDELWELPFQALQTPARRYLLEDYTLSYAPSLLTLEKMTAQSARRSRARAGSTGAGPKRLLLALGDPSLNAAGAGAEPAARPCNSPSALPGAGDEVRQLSREIYAGRGDGYVGAEATEGRFKRDAGNYNVIHLATHGGLDDDDPLFSQIILSSPPKAPATTEGTAFAEDGLLEAWEIARLRLNADLVVLSACETARGRVGEGEGVIGLTWALAVAGTPATVASQWVVNSRSTTDLMVDFHRRLAPRLVEGRAGVGPAAALQQAALKMMNNPDRPSLQHPYFWAGFIVVGDGR